MFRHPKYYKELRKRNKLAGANSQANRVMASRYPGSQLSDQVISGASATARVQRASWSGPKASSFKQQAQRDSSFKRQASSPKQQASSDKPQATSSWIRDPSKSFKHL